MWLSPKTLEEMILYRDIKKNGKHLMESFEVTEKDIHDIIKDCETDETDGVHIVLRKGVYPHAYHCLTQAFLRLLKGENEKEIPEE